MSNFPKRNPLTIIFLIVLTVVAGCKQVSINPAQKIKEDVKSKHPDVTEFQFSDIMPTPLGDVIIFSYKLPGSDDSFEYWLRVANLNKTNNILSPWKLTYAQSYGAQNDTNIVGYAFFGFSTTSTYSIAYGEITSDQVTTVEGIQNDGTSVTQNLSGQFVALFSEEHKFLCKIILRGEDALILAEKDISDTNCIDDIK